MEALKLGRTGLPVPKLRFHKALGEIHFAESSLGVEGDNFEGSQCMARESSSEVSGVPRKCLAELPGVPRFTNLIHSTVLVTN